MKNYTTISQLLAEVNDLLSSCCLCARNCGVNRLEGETGYCGLGKESYIFKDFIHFGEEGGLAPSHTIYFSGCNMRCGFCDNPEYAVNRELCDSIVCAKVAVNIDKTAGIVNNVNFLGGEPTVNLLNIIKILSEMKSELPVVWNSNMYASAQAMRIIDQITDVYIADFKFGNNDCALRVADAGNYFETVTENLLAISDGKRVVIRHLPLPGHVECCSKPLLSWIAANLPVAELSVIPALFPNNAFKTSASALEYAEVHGYAASLGLKHIPAPVALQPNENERISNEKLSTTIVVNSDGTILFQDVNSDLAKIANGLQNQ